MLTDIQREIERDVRIERCCLGKRAVHVVLKVEVSVLQRGDVIEVLCDSSTEKEGPDGEQSG